MTIDLTTALGNLPAEQNRFVGRERDLADLVAILGRVRALTLCGPGGIGKTRLALRLASLLAPQYTDGAWIADVADLDSNEASGAEGDPVAAIERGGEPSRLVTLVTAAIGIRQEADRQLVDTLTESLRPRAMLLVLDTCEHMVAE